MMFAQSSRPRLNFAKEPFQLNTQLVYTVHNSGPYMNANIFELQQAHSHHLTSLAKLLLALFGIISLI